MGEHKIPQAPPKRPDEALLRLKMAVEASKREAMDADTAEFMRDLGAMSRWMDHLEAEVARLTPVGNA